jgi:hypothetical protein
VGVKSRADRSSVLVGTLHRSADELKLTGHGGETDLDQPVC